MTSHIALARMAGPTALVLAALVLSGCVSSVPPVIDSSLATMAERPVVIFVPGLTGSILYDVADERVAWGDARSALLPRDLGYSAVSPIGPATDRILAREPITEIRIGPLYRKELYRPLVTSLEANGYRTGVDLVLFGYDWRRSNVESARTLTRVIDEVSRDKPVVLICQSSGGYLCRWAVRFGNVGLDEAERGVVRRPSAEVRSVVFLGTTHGGSIRILREINRGRTYVKFGRYLSPELFFTFESLYQDLPPWRDDLFVDEQGHPLEVELFDARTWERYAWAIFDETSEARANRRPDLFGSHDERLEFLQRALDDAKRFHALLDDGPPPPPSIALYSIQNRSHRTIDRAMLVERDGAWQTLFSGDPSVDDRPELETVMTTLGDSHAGVAGQEALSEGERGLLAEPVIEVDGDHLGVIHSSASRAAILRIIGRSAAKSHLAETAANVCNTADAVVDAAHETHRDR